MLTILSVFVLSYLVPQKAVAQCSYPEMTFHSPVLISGVDGQVGAVYLFAEVLPGVDAHIEVIDIVGGATLFNIDDTAGVGYYHAFQPYVGAAPNDTSYIDWKITFKVGGTSTDSILPCLAVTGVDVDGDNSSLQEFIEAATPGSIAVDPYTILNVTFDGIRSKAVSTVFNLPLIDTAKHEAMFQMNFKNISTLLYRNGAISTWGAQQIRQTCIYFKSFFHEFQILPVRLVALNAKSAAGITRVQWTAENEKELASYTVQKSVDSKTWRDIRIVKRGESSLKNEYSAVDMEKNDAVVYYRLKQLNSIGVASYSKVMKVTPDAQAKSSITHNTILQGIINYEISANENDIYSFDYYTSTGVKVKQDRIQVYAGVTSKTIQFPTQLTSGNYFVVVNNGKGQQVHRSSLVKY